MIGPHRTGERVVFAIANGRRGSTAQVRIHPEAQRIADNLNPQVTARIGGSPAKDDQRIELLKAAAPFKRVAIQRFQHLGQTALLKDMPGILTFSLATCLLSLVVERRAILVCCFSHSAKTFQQG